MRSVTSVIPWKVAEQAFYSGIAIGIEPFGAVHGTLPDPFTRGREAECPATLQAQNESNVQYFISDKPLTAEEWEAKYCTEN
jgi:hypothetical protein